MNKERKTETDYTQEKDDDDDVSHTDEQQMHGGVDSCQRRKWKDNS